MDKLVIGCDIGGVIRDLITEEAITEGIETLKKLQASNFRVVFISKCKEAYKARSQEWLSRQDLRQFSVFYCRDYEGKNEITLSENVAIMIDDKMQVLSRLDAGIFKIWLCDDDKKIEGAKKFQPDFFAGAHLARNWVQVEDLIIENFNF